MHQTTKDGLWTVTLTFAEWTAISVGYETAMRAAKLRDTTLEPIMQLAESLVAETDNLAGVDDDFTCKEQWMTKPEFILQQFPGRVVE